MKTLKLAFLLLATACAFVACNEQEIKEKEQVTSLIGTWQSCYSEVVVEGSNIRHEYSGVVLKFSADSVCRKIADGKEVYKKRVETIDDRTFNFVCNDDDYEQRMSFCGEAEYRFKDDSLILWVKELVGAGPYTFVKIND